MNETRHLQRHSGRAGLDIDVLIVGAGPTGLMLANQLARRGIRTMIIDRHSGPSLQTRALGVQARTLEIYAKLGIADRAVELGKPGNGADMWSDGRHIGRVGFGDAGKSMTPYAYLLVLGQDDNERIMGERLCDWNLSVQWNTELVALQQEPEKVSVTLKLTDGTTRKLTAAYVAGCDGARSAVRELNAITFPGAPYEHVFFVADVEVTGTMVPEEVNIYLWKKGFHLFFPMRGKDHWRIVGIVPPELRDRENLDFDSVTPSLRNEAGNALSFTSCSWFSTYRIHHRSASRFRVGRCFVLGDAAHIHSPVGAQGMNTGLQDAYNLAWKLALVVSGKAEAALLDSYEAERLPVAQRLLNTTDRAFRLIVSDSWFAGLMRTKVIARIAAFAMKRKWMQQFGFRMVSQIGIHYRKSSLSVCPDSLPKGAPQAGDRFPWLKLKLQANGQVEDLYNKLDDTKFQLLVFGQAPSVAAFGDLVEVHIVPADSHNDAERANAGIPQTSFYLLRPDGHVGLCGTSIDVAAVERYLETRIGLR
jgi:2-polyprenyl-6-methoxyphenol hydroxylase-like FAD-dependent oxidoreductase